MKVRPSVKKMCDKCRVIRRRGTHPRDLHEPAAQAAAGVGGGSRMARIAGVDLPRDKRLDIALTYIYGVGTTSAYKIVAGAGDGRRRRRSATSPRTRSLKIREFIDRELQGRGRPPPRGRAGHQAQDRDRLLPGHPPPSEPPGPRAAHAHQRAHPQGPEEDHRRQEEGRTKK